MSNILSKIINIGITGAEKATAGLKSIQDNLVKIKDNLKGVNDIKLDTTKVDKLNKALKETAKAEPLKKVETNAKSASEGINQLSSSVEGLGANLGPLNNISSVFSSAKAGIGSLINSFGLLKGAIAATGIGALLIAVGLLVRAFSRSGSALETLDKTLTGINFVLDKLTANLIQFGKDVAKYVGTDLVEYFSKPKQVIIDLGNLIYDNIVNRFIGAKEAIISFGSVIGNVLSGNFKKAGNAAIQLSEDIIKTTTGIDDAYGKIGKGVDGLIDGIKTLRVEFNKGFTLEDNLIAINKQLANFDLALAKASSTVEKAQTILDSQSLSYEEQLKAIDNLTNAKQKQITIEAGFNSLELARINLLIAKNDESVRKTEDRTKLLNAIKIKEIELSNRTTAIQIENINKVNVANQVQTAKQLELIKIVKDARDRDITASLFSSKANLEARIANNDAAEEAELENFKQSLLLATNKAKNEIDLTQYSVEEQKKIEEAYVKFKNELSKQNTAGDLARYIELTKAKVKADNLSQDQRSPVANSLNETIKLQEDFNARKAALTKESNELDQKIATDIINNNKIIIASDLEIRSTELNTSKILLDAEETRIDKSKELFGKIKDLKFLNLTTLAQGEEQKQILIDTLKLEEDILTAQKNILKVKQDAETITDDEKNSLKEIEADLDKIDSKRKEGLASIEAETDAKLQTRKEKIKGIINEIVAVGQEALQGVSEIVNTLFEAGAENTSRQLDILDNQLTKIEDRINTTNDLINESVDKTLSLQDKLNGSDERRQRGVQKQLAQELKRQEALRQLKIKDAVAARGIQVQEVQLKREQAKADKDKAIINAAINTALAVTAALASGPPPANLILAAISAAAGAISIGVIASQPLPFIPDPPPLKFAEGGFTPAGNKDTAVGIVHAGEYVVPKNIVDNPNFRPIIDGLESKRLTGFATGGFTNPINPVNSDVNEILTTGFTNQNKVLTDLFNRTNDRPIVVSVVDINDKQDQVRKIDVSSRF